MARLHEYQGKALLAEHGFTAPRGRAVSSADEAAKAAEELGGAVVVKIQAWTTGRKAMGGVALVDTPEEARAEAERMLAMKVGNFPVREVLVEEKLAIKDELFVSLSIDDANRRPVILLSLVGGSGIEQRAGQVARLACDPVDGPDEGEIRRLLVESPVDPALHDQVLSAVLGVFAVARDCEARSVEINPLVTTADGRVVAADCRMTIDDYAVFRHPELGIDIARELDHPPTALERVAYAVEQADHRGTFYFAQLATRAGEGGGRGLVGFPGAGGGGSMMSMDAIVNEGFTIANFTDTSGNPSAAKVYRAARIILAQPGLCGYFGSGSGVASQEQFWSAYGLAKAFWEMELSIPAVIRLGGNSEDRAVEILEAAGRDLPATVEGYRKDDTPALIAARFAELVGENGGKLWPANAPRRVPGYVGADGAFSFAIAGGTVWIDADQWAGARDVVLEHAGGLLKDEAGRPALAVEADEIAKKDSELILCEVECRRAGFDVLFVDLDIPGLEEITTESTEGHGGGSNG
jgi:succinyl-CoA synthetase beta subunit